MIKVLIAYAIILWIVAISTVVLEIDCRDQRGERLKMKSDDWFVVITAPISLTILVFLVIKGLIKIKDKNERENFRKT